MLGCGWGYVRVYCEGRKVILGEGGRGGGFKRRGRGGAEGRREGRMFFSWGGRLLNAGDVSRDHVVTWNVTHVARGGTGLTWEGRRGGMGGNGGEELGIGGFGGLGAIWKLECGYFL